MHYEDTKVLDKVALVHLDVSTWSGRKKLRPEDIKGSVPPKKLASLGSKRIVDPKKVAVFESLKRRAERLLGAIGVRTMGTYAVPIDRVKELNESLREIKEEFLREKDWFLDSYHASVEAWIDEQEEWGEIIRSAITPVSEVRNQLGFTWQVFHVQPTGIDDDGLSEEVGGLAGRLFNEISREATRIFEESFLMKTKVGQRALRPIRAIQEKLQGLAFLDARAYVLSKFLDQILSTLPKVGSIEGEQLNKLFGLLIVLSSPTKVAKYGQDLLDGVDVTDSELISLSGMDDEDEENEEVEATSIEQDDDTDAEPPEVQQDSNTDSIKAAQQAWF